jgi:hypothetical protein
MRRLIAVAAFLVLAASLPLAAQHGGGGHASGGGHGGFAAHGSFGGGHSFSGIRSGSGFAPRRSSSFRSPLASRGFNPRGFNRFNGLRFRNGFRNNCRGYGCGYGWGLDPYWWWDGSSYDQDQEEQTGLANEMNQQSLYEQRMRQQDGQDVYARSAPPPPHPSERTEAADPTVLIFRDQHQQEIQNYAIVGQTVWVFAPQHTQKIPLSDLDIPATTRINDERGVDFRVPGANEGQ